MNIKIRQATRNDFASILTLNKRLFEYERQWGDTYNIDWTYSPKGRAYFAGRIENGIVLVAEIENMYIESKYRQTGVGSKLITKLKEELRKLKVKRIKVDIIFKNISATEFFKKNGFIEHELILEQSVERLTK